MAVKSLQEVVTANPFPDYQEWWTVGTSFTQFMSEAIVGEWKLLAGNTRDALLLRQYVDDYIRVVYDRENPSDLVRRFLESYPGGVMQSGEFDALSYAFFRTAFELLALTCSKNGPSLALERRHFTKRVGRRFYQALHKHLELQVPAALESSWQLDQFRVSLARIGEFLESQGYLRGGFSFDFAVRVNQPSRSIDQPESRFLHDLRENGLGYGLYTMGYPVILPSAVYLFNMIGEAQHHSSRTIEELFERAGCHASESADFDPTDFPSDRVVELWEIRRVLQHPL